VNTLYHHFTATELCLSCTPKKVWVGQNMIQMEVRAPKKINSKLYLFHEKKSHLEKLTAAMMLRLTYFF
jgi:hypothetical protein